MFEVFNVLIFRSPLPRDVWQFPDARSKRASPSRTRSAAIRASKNSSPRSRRNNRAKTFRKIPPLPPALLRLDPMLIRFGTIRASKNSARKSSTEDTNQRILGRRGHVGLGEEWTNGTGGSFSELAPQVIDLRPAF